MIRFGPSGNSESFYSEGYKSSRQMPQWLKNMGLDAYEYSCSKGVKIGKDSALEIAAEAEKNGIQMSIHAPYYINLASTEEEKRINSIRYIMQTLEAARWMKAKRIVIHTGACSKVSREWALEMAEETLRQAMAQADAAGYGDIAICPEVLGKINQLGSLEEILHMCKMDERLIPTIDFGHLHARSQGGLKHQEDFEVVLDNIENSLGRQRLKNIHIHFSRIEFGKGGEKRHMIFDETEYGPEFIHLAKAIYRRGMEPVIICESRGTMAEDALKMKLIYNELIH